TRRSSTRSGATRKAAVWSLVNGSVVTDMRCSPIPLLTSRRPDPEDVLPVTHSVPPALQAEAAAEDLRTHPAAAVAGGDVAGAAVLQDLKDDLLAPGVDEPVFADARSVILPAQLHRVVPDRGLADYLQHPVGGAFDFPDPARPPPVREQAHSSRF